MATKQRWSIDDTNTLVRLWKERAADYRVGKKAFYVATADQLTNKDWKSVKNRCEFLDRKYESIKIKLQPTLADSPTVRASVTKELEWYYELDTILGSLDGPSRRIGQKLAAHGCSTRPTTHHGGANAANANGNPNAKANTGAKTNVSAISNSSFKTNTINVNTDIDNANANASSNSNSNSNYGFEIETSPNANTSTIASIYATTNKSSKNNSSNTANAKKRKHSDLSLAEVVRDVGEQWLSVERERLALIQRQCEMEMLARREELALRRERADQRRQEFELTFQTLRAQYDLDRAALEVKLRKT